MHTTLTYPAMPGGRFFTKGSVRGYRFGFNGQMKDDEVYGDNNAYDFGSRIYDPRLGRFMSVDPLFQKYLFQAPYVFAENCPIKYIDMLGQGAIEPEPTVKKVYTPSGTFQGFVAWGDKSGMQRQGEQLFNLNSYFVNKLLETQKTFKREIAGLMITDGDGNIGFYVHDFSKNSERESDMGLDYMTKDPTSNNTYVTIENKQYKVLAIIHTHPDDDGTTTPSIVDGNIAETWGVSNYIVHKNSIQRISNRDEGVAGVWDENGAPRQDSDTNFKVSNTEDAMAGKWTILQDIKKPQKTKSQQYAEKD